MLLKSQLILSRSAQYFWMELTGSLTAFFLVTTATAAGLSTTASSLKGVTTAAA